MYQALVDRQEIGTIHLHERSPAPLAAGQARLRIESFALTANNVTYAASGDALGYWQFFPSDVEGQGIVPVWGSAEVVESRSDALRTGERLYGFWPMSESCVIMPERAGATITDISAHRSNLPALYNRYGVLSGAAGPQDHLRALLQPLLATSYLLSDWLADNAYFGARQIVIGSASSKTGLALAKFLGEKPGRVFDIIGLTSAGNKDFVLNSEACDAVFTYDQIGDIARLPSVYVDMAGNSAVKAALHGHLGEALKHSAAVGLSHWDQFQPKAAIPGPKPEFFFAPAQVAKRRKDWGPGVVEAEISKAWKRLAADAEGWLTLEVHDGLKAALAVYREIAAGHADPRTGKIIVL